MKRNHRLERVGRYSLRISVTTSFQDSTASSVTAPVRIVKTVLRGLYCEDIYIPEIWNISGGSLTGCVAGAEEEGGQEKKQ
jgi:hypothetical protein